LNQSMFVTRRLYTNVHEFIPWRTLTGRQQLYQDHPWMIDFGEALVSYRPPINTKTVQHMLEKHGDESPTVLLNFITPHQKWGIHSTYTDNLHMLTLVARRADCLGQRG
jgi:nitrate reductase alpha subunit